MTYEVQFQVGTAEYTVRGPDIDGVLRLIQGVQGTEVVPEYETRRDAAEATLRGMKYEWRGGEQWAPPLGEVPAEFQWIEWSGGAQPTETLGKLVRCVCRRGDGIHYPADALYWEHKGQPGDIVRYRVCA